MGKIVKTMFAPSSEKRWLDTYPEMRRIKEFQRMDDRKLKFAWYYGIVYRHIKDKSYRINISMRDAYGQSLTEDLRRRYVDGNWDRDVSEAVKIFESYNLTLRMKARAMVEKTIQTYEEIISKDMNELVEANDWDTINKWSAMAARVNEEMPKLIAKMEGNFGIGEVEINAEDNMANYMDNYYEQKIVEGEFEN